MNLTYLNNNRSRERARRMFATTVPTESGCIEWARARFDNGYGQFPIETCMGRMQQAHRVSYLLHYGPFDPTLFIRHKCHNRACVNPEHLRLGTHQDNMDDMVRADRQYRPRGELHGRALLTHEDVIKIRKDHPVLTERMSKRAANRELGRLHGVSWQAIDRVVSRRNWSHI
jgi:hypothetical protein